MAFGPCILTLGKPLVSGAAIGMHGQVAIFNAGCESDNQTPTGCYRCLYPKPAKTQESCAESGVLGPVPGTLTLNSLVDTWIISYCSLWSLLECFAHRKVIFLIVIFYFQV